MDIWDDREERERKKRRRIMRHAAHAIGGAVGLFFLKFIIPEVAGVSADVVQGQLTLLALWSLFYGLSMAALFAFRQQAVMPVNAFMVWIATPCVIGYAVLQLLGARGG